MATKWRAVLLPIAFLLSAALLSCGSATSSTDAGNISKPGPGPSSPPDFSLSVSPAAIALTAGAGAEPISVSVAPRNGFTGSVNIVLNGLPTEVTAVPASLTIAPGIAQVINLTAAQSAAAGTSTAILTAASGALSHSAQVALTVAAFSAQPGQNFTLSAAPGSLALAPGGAGQQTTIAATSANGFAGTVGVTFSGLPAGVAAAPASLILVPGSPQQVTLSAAASASAANVTATVAGVSGMLSASTPLTVQVTAPAPSNDVTTYHDDNARTGQNLKETTLTPANVSPATFGKIDFLPVDGKVDAEPLYLQNLTLNGQAHNVLYAASEHDSVYAFDADTGAQLWKTSLLEAGETTSDDHSCSQISPEIGITATPVIDRYHGQNGAIFVVGMSKDSSSRYHQRLHALDIATGAELAGSPVEVAASYPGAGANSSGGKVIFDPGQYAERAGLLLLNGAIYTAWTSHCDHGAYTGWLMPFSESTLQPGPVLNLTPNGSEGAIWMSGAGLAADAGGNIYFLDANGTFDTTFDVNGFPSQQDFGNAFLKVSTAGSAPAVADFFAIDNTVAESGNDVDLGSGGALLLPDVTDSSGGGRQLAVGAGKDTNLYVVDRNHMGKFSASGNSIYQELPGAIPNGVWAMPAYFDQTVYYGGVGDPLEAFPIVNARLAAAPASLSVPTFVYPGTTPSISANGTSNGIVWAVANTNPAILYAFNAANLQELYNSNQAPAGRDSFGAGNKFITPMIANGKVFVGTQSGVAIFGLLP